MPERGAPHPALAVLESELHTTGSTTAIVPAMARIEDTDGTPLDPYAIEERETDFYFARGPQSRRALVLPGGDDTWDVRGQHPRSGSWAQIKLGGIVKRGEGADVRYVQIIGGEEVGSQNSLLGALPRLLQGYDSSSAL